MATVMIWNNNQITYRFARLFKYGPAAKAIEGHAALNIDDDFVSIVEPANPDAPFNNKGSYVSWIPSNCKWGHDWEESHHGKTKGVANRNFFEDLMFERYVPDHIIRIPNVPTATIQRMKTEWIRHLNPKNGRGQTYDFKMKNCSRIVSRVLRKGWQKGAGNIKYGQLVRGLWTPLMVKRLTLDLKGATRDDIPIQMTWDDFVDELVNNGVIAYAIGVAMKKIRRRASNRGSSQADARFKTQGSWLKHLRRGWRMDKEAENFDVEIFVYLELIASGVDKAQAKQTLMDWLSISYGQNDVPTLTQWADENINKMRGIGATPRVMIKRKGGLKGKI